MNILVVGGAGYIGSHAVRLLMDAGHTVCVYDNLSRGHREAVPEGLLVADASRAREWLDWTPQYTDVKSIVETAWQGHKSHPHGYAKAQEVTRAAN
jgi:UDP-glucose 4-epimerase